MIVISPKLQNSKISTCVLCTCTNFNEKEIGDRVVVEMEGGCTVIWYIQILFRCTCIRSGTDNNLNSYQIWTLK